MSTSEASATKTKATGTATGKFVYLDVNGGSHTLENPKSDTCLPLPGGAVSAVNHTNHKAQLYPGNSCTGTPIVVLVPEEPWNPSSPHQADRVRFEFA